MSAELVIVQSVVFFVEARLGPSKSSSTFKELAIIYHFSFTESYIYVNGA